MAISEKVQADAMECVDLQARKSLDCALGTKLTATPVSMCLVYRHLYGFVYYRGLLNSSPLKFNSVLIIIIRIKYL